MDFHSRHPSAFGETKGHSEVQRTARVALAQLSGGARSEVTATIFQTGDRHANVSGTKSPDIPRIQVGISCFVLRVAAK